MSTSPDEPDPVSLNKPSGDPATPEPPADFDPYRFGAPEHPVPPEYAPPGYRPPPPTQPPPAQPYGRYPYQQHQYPSVPPPPYHQYPQPRTGNGKAIAALVLGIGSIVFCFLSVLDALLVIPAVILGVLALSDARHGRTGGRAMAQWGIALAVVGAIAATVLTVYIAHRYGSCLHLKPGSSEFTQCVQGQ
jgi:hypothetical protein